MGQVSGPVTRGVSVKLYICERVVIVLTYGDSKAEGFEKKTGTTGYESSSVVGK